MPCVAWQTIWEVLYERVHDVLARKGPRFDLIDGRPLPNIPCLPPFPAQKSSNASGTRNAGTVTGHLH